MRARVGRLLGRCVLVLLAACFAAEAQEVVAYHVSLAQPQQHLFGVEISTTACRNGHLVLELPAWNALYQIRDFAQYVREFHAQDAAGQPLPAEKTDKQTWDVSCQAGALVHAGYRIFWNESSPFSSQLDHRHAFINFADILMYLPEHRELPVTVEFDDVPSGWRLGGVLSVSAPRGRLEARSYDQLADTPVELGTFDEWDFDVDSITFRVIVHGNRRSYSREKMTQALQAIIRADFEMLGTPFKGYVFLFHFLPDGGTGGMEHAYSTAIHLSEQSMRDDPLAFARTAAHEFFHAWNVKRIRPQQLEPVDYTREDYTRALWFAEGGTTAYEMYTMVRAGLYNRQQFYESLAEKIQELEERPARRWKSLEESSLEAWLEKYPFYRRPEQSFSYYTKGAIVTILLDLAIRETSDNHRSLDDVLRHLNENFAHQHRFYDDRRDLPAAAAAVAGRDFGDFFRRFVSGTDEIPYDEFLRIVGLRLRREMETRGWLGLEVFRGVGGEMVVVGVEPNSPADRAGVVEGDLLVVLDGERVGRNFDRKVRRLSVGRTVSLRLRRGEEERELKLVVGARPAARIRIEEMPEADARARRLREAWLQGRTD